MRKFKRKKVKSIFRKLFVPIFFVMILQSCIFYFSSAFGGITDILDANARDNVINKVSYREREIETLFMENWSNMTLYANSFNQLYEKYERDSDIPMYENMGMQEKFLADVSGILISMLRNNEVNGVFLILNNEKELVTLDEKNNQAKKGICIRDYDQYSEYSNIEDLKVIRCPASAVSDVGCSKDECWESDFIFKLGSEADYYYQPLSNAYNGVVYEENELAYFSGEHSFAENDTDVVSYSIPLRDSHGYPYGVLGVELTTEYLSGLLPSDELGIYGGSYAIVKYNEGKKSYDVISSSGKLIEEQFNLNKGITSDIYSGGDFFTVAGKSGENICGSFLEISSDSTIGKSAGNYIALIGLVTEDSMYYFQKNIRLGLLFVAFVGLIIGGIAIFIVSVYLSKPINNLARKVKKMEPEPNFKLERLGISEIDQLVMSIEDLSHNISESKARTEFFSRMSHDMRTPMNAIISFSSPEMLKGTNETEKDDFLYKINTSACYLLGLINEVLDMTKIESGKMEIREENMSLKKLWEATATMIGKLAAEKNIEFKMVVPTSGVSYIVGDYQRLSQIMVNLLSNAVKFTKPGGHVTFTFMVIDVTPTTLNYCMSVKDDGIGMSEEFQKHLYEPFVQGNTKQEGTGLGLSIARQLVELMGGKIECISKLGEGTEFLVYLENRIGSRQEQSEEEVVLIDDMKQIEGKRILLCEDHMVNCQIATRLLERKKMKVEIAHNGKEGVEMFDASDEGYYDGILMDIRMPVMSGLEAAAAIRALSRGDAGTIPIIAMTANAFESDVQEAKDAGMNAHLSKPIEPQILYDTLVKFLAV